MRKLLSRVLLNEAKMGKSLAVRYSGSNFSMKRVQLNVILSKMILFTGNPFYNFHFTILHNFHFVLIQIRNNSSLSDFLDV